jgi:hypothetical protein
MAILNYTTKIDHYSTISDIQQCLSKRGAQKIIIDNNNEGIPVSISFMILWNDKPIAFQLPCNFAGVLKSMQRNKKVPRSLCTQEQAIRVGWRIVKVWVEAQMAIVEAEVATMAEVFLPYAISKNGKTLYEYVSSNQNNLLLTN